MGIIGNDFVDRIDEILVKRNLKRKALADFVGFSTQSITDWSKRGNFPAADTALKIAEYLGVSVEWLITGEDKNMTNTQMHILRLFNEVDEHAKDDIVEYIEFRYEKYIKSEKKSDAKIV